MGSNVGEHRFNDLTSPLVSIVVLTYDRFDGLSETLRTISEQDYERIELIISDDGSKYFPQEDIEHWLICYGLEAATIRRNSENQGIVAHSNFVAGECRGEYIKFLPPGDGFSDAGALRLLVKAAANTDAQILTSQSLAYIGNYADVRYRFPSDRRIQRIRRFSPSQLYRSFAVHNSISAIGTIYHKSFFEEGGFDTTYRNLDDWPTWLAWCRNGKKLEIVAEPTVYYELSGISNGAGNAFDSKLLQKDMLRCYEKEILPFLREFSLFARWNIRYHYGVLKEDHSKSFQIRYFPFHCYRKLKKMIKKCFIGIKG